MDSKNRRLMSGAFADFIQWLAQLPNPIVVGMDYRQSREKVLEAFLAWSKARNYNTQDANVKGWRDAYTNNELAGEPDDENLPQLS